ncbi:MAG: TonB-dependent receptor, partial [Pseudohongiellaceae bacterium]
PNRLVTGYSYFDGQSRFHGELELADLDPISRSTSGLGTGTFVEEAATSINTSTRTWSLYFTDTLDLTERLSVTLAGRYNEINTRLRDRSGERPELNGRHRFSRFNPAVGMTYAYTGNTTLFLSYNEANRVPTPIELSCNDQIFSLAREYAEAEGDDPDDVEFECRLPNAFLADPPLDDVVTRNVEAGVRGNANGLIYSMGLFHAVNRDDIIFQTTGRATGLFANVDRTRRMGLEAAVAGNIGRMDWYASYSQVRATFEDDFTVLSPNHDFADTDGTIAVTRGDRIPGIPRHQFKFGVDFALTTSLNLGLDGFYNSSQTLRGDESNQLNEVDGFQVVNLRATYKVSDIVTLFARVTNLFDSRYESFGLLGEDPSELLDFISDESPYFLGPGAPRGAWLGARVLF